MTDPDLAALIAAWPDLPEPIRAGIAAMVRAAVAAPSLRHILDENPRPAISIHDFRRSAITNWSKRVNL